MKKTVLACLVVFAVAVPPAWLPAQEVDLSQYREISLGEAAAIPKSEINESLRFKTLAHFCDQGWYSERATHIAVFQSTPGDSVNFQDDAPSFPKLRPFGLAWIYWRFVPYMGHYLEALDWVEPVDRNFIEGVQYEAMENLRLRDSGSLSDNTVATIPKGNTVTVLEEEQQQTIDGIVSAWARVRTSEGTEGWCFGGYLGWTTFGPRERWLDGERVWAGMEPFSPLPESLRGYESRYGY